MNPADEQPGSPDAERPGSPDAEPLGSAAEEARKLMAALQDFARRTTGEHIATGAPECRLCPVCQLISLVRDTRPEVIEHLTGAAAALLSALRSLMASQEASSPHAGTSAGSGGRGGDSTGPPGVQHIDIG